jgi:hypothetical protein
MISPKGVRCFATFKMNDPMPFIFLFYKEMKHFINKIFLKTNRVMSLTS